MPGSMLQVLSATILQQIFEVEFVVVYGQCPECTRLAAKNTWRALVQVRQKVDHKRTFLYLEQLILKHGADKDTISIKEVRDGLDFFYSTRQHALKMVDFLTATTPVRTKTSEQLISLDIQNASTNYKSTYSVEIIPICKDDLVCLSKKTAHALGTIGQVTLCSRIGNSVHLLDPLTLQQAEITGSAYWRAPFAPLASCPAGATEFVVLDIEPAHHPPKTANRGRFLLADAQVAPVGGSMDSDAIIHTRTHLGAVLKPGDTVLGYLLSSSNFNNDAWDALNNSSEASRIPEIILVRKTYPERRKKSKPRKWKLKTLAKEAGDDHLGLGRVSAGEKKGRGNQGLEQQKAEADYERFLQDLEEDKELREAVNLYKAQRKVKDVDAMDVESNAGESTIGTEADDDFPQVRPLLALIAHPDLFSLRSTYLNFSTRCKSSKSTKRWSRTKSSSSVYKRPSALQVILVRGDSSAMSGIPLFSPSDIYIFYQNYCEKYCCQRKEERQGDKRDRLVFIDRLD